MAPLRTASALLIILLVGFPLATSAQNIASNGDFEVGVDPGSFARVFNGQTNITDWTVLGPAVDYIGSLWQHASGERSVALDGNTSAPGGLSQDIVTMPGALYEVNFWLAGNPDQGPTIKTMRVEAAGQSMDFEFDITGRTFADMGWVQRSWIFEANASVTTLIFMSTTNPSGWGPAIDAVDVRAANVPTEDSTWGKVKALYQ